MNGQPTNPAEGDAAPRLSLASLSLSNFRNYRNLSLDISAAPVVLLGANGAGKTNLLEAVSLLAPGQGLRRANFVDLARAESGSDDWAVASQVISNDLSVYIGTGMQAGHAAKGRSGRLVRIDGVTQSGSGSLADYIEMVWLTPASDGLFVGPASERRRFLDRLILCFDPAYRTRAGQFDRAMRQRNRLLDDGARSRAQFEGLETIMAETGVAIAAARVEVVRALELEMQNRRARASDEIFPWADVALDGEIERYLEEMPAIDAEDRYRETLDTGRERDRAAGRTLTGPHRSDLVVSHGPKSMAARLCSTGEQKALLISLVLAHAELSAARRSGVAPILLLDEIAAHLDVHRRSALFDDLLRIGTQAWMTGTDRSDFSGLEERAQFCRVDEGIVTQI